MSAVFWSCCKKFSARCAGTGLGQASLRDASLRRVSCVLSRACGTVSPNAVRQASRKTSDVIEVKSTYHSRTNCPQVRRPATQQIGNLRYNRSGKFKTHHLVNVHARNEDLQPPASSTAHRQLLISVKGLRRGNS